MTATGTFYAFPSERPHHDQCLLVQELGTAIAEKKGLRFGYVGDRDDPEVSWESADGPTLYIELPLVMLAPEAWPSHCWDDASDWDGHGVMHVRFNVDDAFDMFYLWLLEKR